VTKKAGSIFTVFGAHQNWEEREEMSIFCKSYSQEVQQYRENHRVEPLFLEGDSLRVLREIPDETFDFCMTSPPYWGKRQYENGGIGLEPDFNDFVASLLGIFAEVRRVLRWTGSFWLNLGDTYKDKSLLCIPYRVAIALMDQQGWVLRNTVIWNKVKGGFDNTNDRLGSTHEPVFHFVKSMKGYYYDDNAIRANGRKSKVVNGSVVTGTGVSGIRYKRQIELSTSLSDDEKADAFRALQNILSDVQKGIVADFRMIIRGQQRATHSDAISVSGRARELEERGHYFLRYHPNGSKPSDVWDIVPEDTQNRKTHFAPYPEDLCRIPLLSTCPPDGIALDPFCGTGTTMLVASKLNRKSVGIDISPVYLHEAEERCNTFL
jgi:DNA modification methylase